MWKNIAVPGRPQITLDA